MTNEQYWVNRMRILEESLLDTGYEYVQNLERQFDIAIRAIEEQTAVWYQRFAANNGITLAEARKLLTAGELREFKWTVEEYIKRGRQNAVSQAWMKQLENASARVHISRLDSLKLQLQQQAEVLYGNQLDDLDGLIGRIYSDGYYHTAFELQRGIGVGWSLHGLTDEAIRKGLSRPWTLDGQTFSDRIWSSKAALVNKVNTELTQMIMRGTAPDKAIRAISERFKVSKSQAGRLVMTESAAFANMARKDCFNDLGVEKYTVVETLDNETCCLCSQLDGKVFPMSEYVVGSTVPPFHPWCRGTPAPYFEDLEGVGDRFARDAGGKAYDVPKDMTYEEWAEKQRITSSAKDGILSESEKKAILDYIGSASYGLNDKLRRGLALTETERRWMKELDAALEKLPAYKGTVYRSVSAFGIENIDDFLLSYHPGAIKTFSAYSAYTSAGTEVYDESFTFQYVIKSASGRDLREQNPGEAEILFPRETQFRVIRVDGYTIFMEEV